ncbi:hypothetical protein PRZ48_003090 [Zasmidium cellare]|uniref:Uncharacterized protein n=1 Tax=Zasmidium cellare TaxID=395010 RepID=A0ABR0EU37_ZASCE|nr:hypothetical protein PRZ48_003090 [Zasmidium cellare]
MYRKVASLLLVAPAAILASPFPQQTTPVASPPTTRSLSTVTTWPEAQSTETVMATLSDRVTTFTHKNELYYTARGPGEKYLYMDSPLLTKFAELIYNKQVCSDAPDRPRRSTEISITATPIPTTSVSTTLQTRPTAPPTLSPSPATAPPSTLTPAAPSKIPSLAPSGNATTQGDSCPVNGNVVCKPNDPTKFGLCNWGKVVWQDVAKGTECHNGTIVGVGAYSPAGHKRSQSDIGVPLSKLEGLSKRDNDFVTLNLLDRPSPNTCFESNLGAIIDGFVGLSTVAPHWEVQAIPHDNTNFTGFVVDWRQYAYELPELSWVNRQQLKESVDRAAVFLMYPENWLVEFNVMVAGLQDNGQL